MKRQAKPFLCMFKFYFVGKRLYCKTDLIKSVIPSAIFLKFLLCVNSMPGKCCVFNCRSNYDNGPKETVFFTDEKKDYDLTQRWITFVNREDWKPSKKSCICRKHFEPHYYKTVAKGKRYRLIKKLKPVPTIFDPEESHFSAQSKYLKSPI